MMLAQGGTIETKTAGRTAADRAETSVTAIVGDRGMMISVLPHGVMRMANASLGILRIASQR